MSRKAMLLFGALWILLVMGLIWFLARPFMEQAVLSRQADESHAVAAYAVSLVETSLNGRVGLMERTARTVIQHPTEAAVVLQNLLDEHPDILQARIHSPEAPDELVVNHPRQSGSIPEFLPGSWLTYGPWDSSRVAFTPIATGDSMVLGTETMITLRGHPFFFTMVWDAEDIGRILTRLPGGSDPIVSITTARGTIWKSWNPDSVSLVDRQVIRERFTKMQAQLTLAASTSALTREVRQGTTFLLLLVLVVVVIPGIPALLRRRSA